MQFLAKYYLVQVDWRRLVIILHMRITTHLLVLPYFALTLQNMAVPIGV